jgi:hypothetical protein
MRRSWLIAPLAALTAVVSSVQPVAAQGGNPGSTVSCAPAPPQVITQYKAAKPVDAQVVASGGISCPTPQNEAPGRFGAGNTKPLNTPPPPQPGTPCHFSYQTPVQFHLNGSNPEHQFLSPQSLTATDPASPTWLASGWLTVPNNVVLQGDPQFGPQYSGNDIYSQAGANNFSVKWDFDGVWSPARKCVAQNNGGVVSGWHAPCANATGPQINACYTRTPAPGPLTAGPTPVGALPIDLNGLVRGRFTGGQISSLPNNPNPGLVNVPTCFYITGMTVNGAAGNPQQEYDWEQIVQGPRLSEGRNVYYVLVVKVHYLGADWAFGDGTTVPVPPTGNSAEPVPSQCGNVPGQQFLVAHTYRHYSAGNNNFQVTVTHHFGADVTEMWRDAAGPHQVDFPQAVAPIPVVPANQPFVKPIVQEEGVPIAVR